MPTAIIHYQDHEFEIEYEVEEADPDVGIMSPGIAEWVFSTWNGYKVSRRWDVRLYKLIGQTKEIQNAIADIDIEDQGPDPDDWRDQQIDRDLTDPEQWE